MQPGRWSLDDLARDHDSPEFEAKVKKVQKKARLFARMKGRLAPDMPGAEFSKMLGRAEAISNDMRVVGGYASLLYASDTQSDQAASLLRRMRKISAETENQMLFFDLWWQKEIDDDNAERLMQDAGDLKEYLRHKRLLSAHSLSEPEERIINTLDVTGISALVKIYDKITNAFEYRVRVGKRTKTVTREELVGLVKSPSAAVRRNAYAALLGKFHSSRGVLGELYQNIVQNIRDEEVQIRGYDSPISVMNASNNIDDRTVSSLLRACRKNAPLFHKFFLAKARMLNMDRLRRYDLYAPISGKAKKAYSYESSVKLVLESLNAFSPVLSGFAKKLLDQSHVDSSVRPGKMSGAFCSTITPRITPFVLVNFTSALRDVFTLAHELGHAVHSMAASNRSAFVQEASLPIAETASTFSELLLYDNLAGKASPEESSQIMAAKLDDLYATIIRQSFFTMFEIEAHKKIAENATVDELSSAYLANLAEQFGSSIDLSDDFAVEWCAIPHFYHAPFYCYAYSFGNLLALYLYRRYKREGADFVPAYLEILAAGNSQKPESLLMQHGIDISSSMFWQEGFEYIRDMAGRLDL